MTGMSVGRLVKVKPLYLLPASPALATASASALLYPPDPVTEDS